MKRIIAMSSLGKMGRFGNQLFEYMFLRVYAERYGLQVQTPRWVGNYLYGFDDLPVEAGLPLYKECWLGGTDAMTKKVPPDGDECVGHDFCGYAQYHTSYYQPYREFIQDLFRPLPKHAARTETAIQRLRDRGDTLIGLHIRRGDYGRRLYHCTPVDWYVQWLTEHLSEYKNPVVFVCSEDRTVYQEESLRKFSPLITENLGVTLSTELYPDCEYLLLDLHRREPSQMDFFPDFDILAHCDVVLASNSTFSFFAALINPTLHGFWRSSLPHHGFIQLDPWDTEPLSLEQSEDYKDTIKGAALDENPYW